PEDPAVYDMICAADTVGIFQIESRAQMSMLPRLRPRCFYDLVIEVGIVRPGPIVGDMVHPYLRRRQGIESVDYPDDTVRAVLEKTLGIPLFQEQAMKLAMVAGGFSPDQADQLRRAIASKRSRSRLEELGRQLIDGMTARGYRGEFAVRCLKFFRGFSEYGFPESHAASFALLVYASAWLKRHHPAAFAAALLNSQPMGFYAPAQIIGDAQRHGVTVLPVDVNFSGWDARLEQPGIENCQLKIRNCRLKERPENPHSTNSEECPFVECGSAATALHRQQNPNSEFRISSALRLGMRMVKSLAERDALAIEQAVAVHGPFRDIESLYRAAGVKVASLRALAAADAFRSMTLDRQAALWQIRAIREDELPLFASADNEPAGLPLSPSPRLPVESFLPPLSDYQKVLHDYHAVGVSLRGHPMSFLRDRLATRNVVCTEKVRDPKGLSDGSFVRVAGVVLVRQRPATAGGTIFLTIEDETGPANIVIRPALADCFKRVISGSTLICSGVIQRFGEVSNLVASHVEDISAEIRGLEVDSRDFR
ncbi:MAG: error-prone DNA polymerase, partial [Phycisphaerae bacterium]|nr:error-prone DNA polymerase [Phycisphaerae bacterium]